MAVHGCSWLTYKARGSRRHGVHKGGTSECAATHYHAEVAIPDCIPLRTAYAMPDIAVARRTTSLRAGYALPCPVQNEGARGSSDVALQLWLFVRASWQSADGGEGAGAGDEPGGTKAGCYPEA
eukprot:3498509-Rhodomonas_salina.1